MDLKKIKTEYVKNKLPKPIFINKMHKIHALLFAYSEYIKDTNIKSIEIKESEIIMTTRKENIKMICDKYDKRIIPIEILNFSNYEQDELSMMEKIIKKILPKKPVIFDIGANIGWYSINFSKINKNAQIYSFEPIPNTFSYLKKHLSMNNVKNTKIFNFGFSNEEKTLSFYYYKEGSGNASLANLSKSKNTEKVMCKVIKMDDFVKREKIKVDFIKCDVEGAELLVLKGGVNVLRRDKPIIFIEMLRKWAVKFNYHPNEIIHLLRSLGYECYIIKKGHLKTFSKMKEDTNETNFIFVHSINNNIRSLM